MGVSVLLVEDDLKCAKPLRLGLGNLGYKVEIAESATRARQLVSSRSFDLILLDLGLPDGSGIELLQEWRGAGISCPILITSGFKTEEDKVTGLDAGADDYLVKPFGLVELTARIRAIFRRTPPPAKATALCLDWCTIDPASESVMIHGPTVHLQHMQFRLLDCFVRRWNREVTREEAIRDLWGEHPGNGASHKFDVHLGKLRASLGVHRAKLQTLPGKRYVLVSAINRPTKRG